VTTDPQAHDKLFRWASFAAALVGAVLVLIATAPFGPGVAPDSVVYIETARNLAAGNGPVATSGSGDTVLMVTWPPLYSMLMAIGVTMGIEAQTAAAVINALAHGGLCIVLALLVGRLTGRRDAALIVAWLAALSPSLHRYAGLALTESVFLLLVTATLLLALGSGRRCIALAGLVAGLACMQRYAGYALVAACAAWLIWSKAYGRAGLFVACAAPLPLAWRIWMLIAGSGVDSREATAAGPTWLHVKSVAHSLSTWLVPETWPMAVRAGTAGLVLIGLLAAAVWAVRRRKQAPGALLILMLAAAYSLLLAVTVMFLDRALQPEPRMLLPLLPLALVATAWALRGRAGFVVAALICLSFAARDVSTIGIHRAGFGYLSIEWRESATLAAALELKDAPVYTNNPQPLIFYGHTQPRTLPVAGTIDYLKPLGAPPYADMQATATELRETGLHGGYAVWFGPYAGQLDGWGLTPVAVYDDGVILRRK
jgi:hypothetical protein